MARVYRGRQVSISMLAIIAIILVLWLFGVLDEIIIRTGEIIIRIGQAIPPSPLGW